MQKIQIATSNPSLRGGRNKTKKNKQNKNKLPMNNLLNGRHAYAISDAEQYVDVLFNTTVSSTTTTSTLFQGIATLLQTVPQITTPVYNNGGVNWRQRILLKRIEARYRCIGAQATALIAADVFNTTRLLVYETRDSLGASTVEPLSAIDDPLNVSDVRFIHYDSVVPLCSHAFNATDVNVPEMKAWAVVMPINRVYDWFTNVTSGTSGWDTKAGDFYFSRVSDSAVTPHPTVIGTFRLYFQMLKHGGRDGQ